jgi:hypothetical protein
MQLSKKEKSGISYQNTLTRKQIVHKTGCPHYTVDYLRQCGRLPIIAESLKRGVPTLFHPDSIKIVQDHLDRRYKSC